MFTPATITRPELITFGYDKDPFVHQRGIARPDWSLSALDYTAHGGGWRMCDLRGNRWGSGNRFTISKEEAIAQLMGS